MDTSLQLQRSTHDEVTQPNRRWVAAFIAVCAASLVGFLCVPGSIEGKSLAVLHGLCAQQPSHSFHFGDQRLPFDARMTGIYGGFAATCLYLLARGRWRHGGIPATPLAVTLGLFIGVMGVDGLNSTLKDLRVWYAYEPHNALRLATGMLTGTSLAAFLWLMIAQVGFSRQARVRRSAITGFRDLGLLLAVQAALAGVVLTGWSPLWLPLTFLLLVSAIAVITGLTLSFVLLLGHREGRALRTADLAAPGTIALVIALIVIGGLGSGRFLLEWWLGIEPMVRSAG